MFKTTRKEPAVTFDHVPMGSEKVPQLLKVKDLEGGGVYASLGDM
jgi:hypothetical protein